MSSSAATRRVLFALIAVVGIGFYFFKKQAPSRPPSSGLPSVSPNPTKNNKIVREVKRNPDSNSTKKPIIMDVGLSEEDRKIWHRTPEGSGIVPVIYLKALTNSRTQQPFYNSLPRYGFIPDFDDPKALPLGFASHTPSNSALKFAHVGINCSACHTGMIEYNGTNLLIDGAPNLSQFEAFIIDFAESNAKMLQSPSEAFGFLKRFIKHAGDEGETEPSFEPRDEAVAFLNQLDEGPLADQDGIPDQLERDIILAFGGGFIGAVGEHKIPMKSRASEYETLFASTAHPDKETWLGHLAHLSGIVSRSITWFIDRIEFTKKLHWAFDNQTYAGPGRGDSFDAVRDLMFPEEYRLALTAPSSFIDLFDLKERQWVHWDANTTAPMQRNVAQAIAFGASFNPRTLETSALPFSLHALETVARKIKVPQWPEGILGKLDSARIQRGQVIYESNCVKCHSYNPDTPQSQERLYSPSEIGTDPNRANRFATPLSNEPFSEALSRAAAGTEKNLFIKHGIEPQDAKNLLFNQNPQWRTTGKYVAKPLKGIWASAPYLHNGSVPNLYLLLQPATARPAKWKCGSRKYDPKHVGYLYEVPEDLWVLDTSKSGNSNAGHEGADYGTELTDAEKWDLIEYLKTL